MHVKNIHQHEKYRCQASCACNISYLEAGVRRGLTFGHGLVLGLGHLAEGDGQRAQPLVGEHVDVAVGFLDQRAVLAEREHCAFCTFAQQQYLEVTMSNI